MWDFFLPNDNHKVKNDYRNNKNAHSLIIVCSTAGISSSAEQHTSAFNCQTHAVTSVCSMVNCYLPVNANSPTACKTSILFKGWGCSIGQFCNITVMFACYQTLTFFCNIVKPSMHWVVWFAINCFPTPSCFSLFLVFVISVCKYKKNIRTILWALYLSQTIYGLSALLQDTSKCHPVSGKLIHFLTLRLHLPTYLLILLLVCFGVMRLFLRLKMSNRLWWIDSLFSELDIIKE